MTAPVRGTARIIRAPIVGGARAGEAIAKGVWRALPATADRRGKFARAMFTIAPFMFFGTDHYKDWKAEKELRRANAKDADERASEAA